MEKMIQFYYNPPKKETILNRVIFFRVVYRFGPATLTMAVSQRKDQASGS